MPPEITFTRDPERFAQQAGAYLSATLERNHMATILHGVRERPFGVDPPLFALVTTQAQPAERIGAMLRTPPFHAVATGLNPSEHANAHQLIIELMTRWLQHDPEIPGIRGEPATVRPLAAAWCTLKNGRSTIEVSEAMHALSATTLLEPPHPARGHLRPATPQDRPLLLTWEQAFIEEAHLGSPAIAPQMLDRRLAHGRQVVWEDAGVPVSTVGFNVVVAGTQRIGPVYTPPERRSHGYATSATAETSRRLLAAGAERCMLLTDLANPTSNRIYASIGYARFADFEEHRFIPARRPPEP